MTSRLFSWARLGILAAVMGCSVSVAAAQGEGRYSGDRRGGIATCGNEIFCGGANNNIIRPRGGDAVRRHYDRPVWRGRNDYRPPRYNYKPPRYDYRPYRPRYYDDYYGGSDVYLDFYTPSYRYYDPAPVYPRRYYRRGVVMSAAHIEWCYNRYRTYREWDNTYVPRRGVRAQCISPYS